MKKQSLILTVEKEQQIALEHEAAKVFSSGFDKEDLIFLKDDASLQKIAKILTILSVTFGVATVLSLIAEIMVPKDTIPYTILTIYAALLTISPSMLRISVEKSLKRREALKKDIGSVIEEALSIKEVEKKVLN